MTEVVKKIEEADALCAKAINQVSHTWEAPINDSKLEKVVEELCTVEMEET